MALGVTQGEMKPATQIGPGPGRTAAAEAIWHRREPRVPPRKPIVPYVPTAESLVESMLDLANVGAGDVLYDLGCGDGRIVIGAAKRGAGGVGIDIDRLRVREGNWNAECAGVSDRVRFVRQSLYDVDLRPATRRHPISVAEHQPKAPPEAAAGIANRIADRLQLLRHGRLATRCAQRGMGADALPVGRPGVGGGAVEVRAERSERPAPHRSSAATQVPESNRHGPGRKAASARGRGAYRRATDSPSAFSTRRSEPGCACAARVGAAQLRGNCSPHADPGAGSFEWGGIRQP